MTEHSFDLAAALVDTAAEQLATTPYGTSHIQFHDFGQFPITATHTIHDNGHTVHVAAYDDHGIIAAAQAYAPHTTDTPAGRIIMFRAAHLSFTALDTTAAHETAFLARGQRLYMLTTAAGTDRWRVGIGDGSPADFDSLDEALDHIVDKLETARTG